MVEDKLWYYAGQMCSGRQVVRFIRGIRYSMAILDDGNAGLAFSFPDRVDRKEKLYSILRSLPAPASAFLELSRSRCTGDRCAAVAVANALLGAKGEESPRMPFLQDARNVLMVGYIEPLYRALQKSGITPYVMDDHYGNSIPLDLGRRLCSTADILILSASSVVNGSWEELSSLARKTWIVGPTAPLFPALYEDTSVEYVMGRSITDVQALATILERGGGTRDMAACTGKICLSIK